MPPVSTTPVVHLSCKYLREFSKKFETAQKGLGEAESWRKPEIENFVVLSLYGNKSSGYKANWWTSTCYPSPVKETGAERAKAGSLKMNTALDSWVQYKSGPGGGTSMKKEYS